jgi:hypothetical protein
MNDSLGDWAECPELAGCPAHEGLFTAVFRKHRNDNTIKHSKKYDNNIVRLLKVGHGYAIILVGEHNLRRLIYEPQRFYLEILRSH